jgi:hypothetical protein
VRPMPAAPPVTKATCPENVVLINVALDKIDYRLTTC